MDVKEQDNIEFLDAYPTKMLKLPFNALMLVVNVGLFLTGVILSGALIFKNSVSYASENPKLYEIVNDTAENDKYMVFNGNATNNYVKFNNMVWRILKVNTTGTISLILDDSINQIPWKIGNDFNVMDYLNNEFLNQIDKTKLVSNKVCSDEVNNLESISCDEVDDSLVSLLDLNTFASTLSNGETFVTRENEKMWLMNAYSDEDIWHTAGSKVSHSNELSMYEIKPVITINNEVIYESGNGTATDPYLIKSDNLTIGSAVKLGDDLYNVYEIKDNEVRLMLQKNIDYKYAYVGNDQSILEYLKIAFYNNLPYKELLIESNYKMVNIKDNKVSYDEYKSVVGIPNLFDIKFNSSIKNYYTFTKVDNYIMVFSDPVIYGTKYKFHELRPTIAISKDTADKLINNNGTYMVGE